MPTLEYFIVAESISVDQSTNRVSLFNILETIEDPLPTQLARFTAVAGWLLSEQADKECEFQVELRLSIPGKPDELKFPLNFTAISMRHRTIIQVDGIDVNELGEMKFSVYLNGAYQASHTVSVLGPATNN